MNRLTATLLVLLQVGFPYVHGNNVPDPVFGDQAPKREFHPPALELAPHAAALGMRFYTGDMFPLEYRGQIFIAELVFDDKAGRIYRIVYQP